MALAVDNTPLSPTCNSYASAEEMLAYLSERVVDPAAAAAWSALSEELQALYLVNATRSLDSFCEWEGQRYYNPQRLGHPRYDVYIEGLYQTIDVEAFPQPVVEATCEMALWAMQNNGVVSLQQNLAFDSIKVGPLAIDFNEAAGGPRDKYFPDVVAIILKNWATLQNPQLPGVNQVRIARLRRA